MFRALHCHPVTGLIFPQCSEGGERGQTQYGGKHCSEGGENDAIRTIYEVKYNIYFFQTSDLQADETARKEKLKERVDEWMSSMVGRMQIPDDNITTG